MKLNVKEAAKYAFVLILTGAIFWYLFRQIQLDDFKSALSQFNFWWIGLSIFLSIFSHILRAWRWKLLLQGSDYSANLSNSYFAVMIGYLANSIFPRLGEVTRCGILNKTDKVPVSISLGTVVTERVIDLFILLIVTAVTFLLQFNLLESYFNNGLLSLKTKLIDNWWILGLLFVLGILGLYLLFYTSLGKRVKLVGKVRDFVGGLWTGITSLKHVKNQFGFWISTLGIWVLYFFMLYVITFGSPLTENLGILAGLSILVMGSFGMATPIPNGVGAFHTLVAGVLVLYGIDQQEGIIFATIMHTSQFITVLVIGSISLILVNIKHKRQSKIGNSEQNKIEE
ncbi:lysylphosphatidylglycerol synthase transmembrane domain-containing protein [uncultured Roseivirga sp.]|uniref:lysylphosphatidylglycerol synthase transmembrane domain-containing protein n=1 Tax=uncultured Roseivirga sp. TaxID=543088 RepID=UPI00258C5784|nr:lysylphosphatidylglycerol synthase transmembrane domain-containing protein [uncultured Roseivirga sp.]